MAGDLSAKAPGSEAQATGSLRRPAKADLFDMANLFPEDTGLPVTVWVSPRGNARHAARIKVCRVAGNRMTPSNTAVVGIAPEPRLIEGSLNPRYYEPVARWVTLNAGALLRYWNGEIGTGGLLRDLQRIDGGPSR